MDVMAAAARVAGSAKAATSCIWRLASRTGRAPASALAAAQGRARPAASPIPKRSACRPLRRRIARHYADVYGVISTPPRVVVTTGSSGGFILAFLSLFAAGDRVALANPGYPPYRHILSALGCEPVLIETSAATRAGAVAGRRCIEAHRRTPLAGLAGRKPGQSDRHHDGSAGAGST